jgi:hypothetical protein
LLKLRAVPVIIVLGLNVFETPLDGGKALNHRTTFASILIIILPGMFLNRRVLRRDLAHSFMSLICRSISGTCSLVAVVLRLTPWLGSSRRRHSNSRSSNAVLRVKPRALYRDTICNKDLIRIGSDRFVTYSIVVNFTFWDIKWESVHKH